MSTQRFDAQDLVSFFDKHKIATMEELKGALGTNVDMTVFRKLRQLSYRTSYSHGNRYYTLDRIADFDEHGLWSCRSSRFSRYGSLLKTTEHFVGHARAGYFAGELQDTLHVGVKESLLKLARQGRVAREKISGRFLYCSANSGSRRGQIFSRRAKEMEQTPEEARMTDKVKAAIVLFLSLLDVTALSGAAAGTRAVLGHASEEAARPYLDATVEYLRPIFEAYDRWLDEVGAVSEKVVDIRDAKTK